MCDLEDITETSKPEYMSEIFMCRVNYIPLNSPIYPKPSEPEIYITM